MLFAMGLAAGCAALLLRQRVGVYCAALDLDFLQRPVVGAGGHLQQQAGQAVAAAAVGAAGWRPRFARQLLATAGWNDLQRSPGLQTFHPYLEQKMQHPPTFSMRSSTSMPSITRCHSQCSISSAQNATPTFSMRSSTSMPSITCPKMVYLPARTGKDGWGEF